MELDRPHITITAPWHDGDVVALELQFSADGWSTRVRCYEPPDHIISQADRMTNWALHPDGAPVEFRAGTADDRSTKFHLTFSPSRTTGPATCRLESKSDSGRMDIGVWADPQSVVRFANQLRGIASLTCFRAVLELRLEADLSL
jgi:hypothetical protein